MTREDAIRVIDLRSTCRECVVSGYDCDDCDSAFAMAIEALKQQKTGHWIYQSQFNTMWDNTCSECGKLFCCERGTYANYCWNCGAKMEIQL